MPKWTHAHTLAAAFIGCCCAAGAAAGLTWAIITAGPTP